MVETRKRKRSQQPDFGVASSSSSSSTFRPANTHDWLPDGWTVAKATGQKKYKVFKETATGKKFYSKPQVFNYLAISDTSDSNNTKVKVAPHTKKQVSSLSTKQIEIPERLYDLIQNAARARKSLKLNSNNMSAKRELEDYELKIHIVTLCCKTNDELPSGWRYDPEIPITAYDPKPRAPPKPQTKMTMKKTQKTKKEIKITWNSPNYHGSYQLNNDEKQVWNFFKKNDTSEARPYMSVKADNYLNMVDKNHMVVDLLGKFAVDTFNRSCQMYVNEDEDNQVSGAEFMECKFYKSTSKYIFYMTIEAIEQGIPGVYETRVECDTEDGAKRLMNFKLTDRKAKWNRPWVKPHLKPEVEYETVQDGSSDPQDYYELTGMVHRPTEGGGFNYHNPRFSPHIIVYTMSVSEDFVPNLSQPLEFPAATKTIQAVVTNLLHILLMQLQMLRHLNLRLFNLFPMPRPKPN